MGDYDISLRLLPSLDPHMQLQVLESLQEKKLYNGTDLSKAKFQLLQKTKMVDSAEEEYKSLYKKDPPKEMEKTKTHVFEELNKAKESCAPLLEVIMDDELVKDIIEQKNFNLDYLKKNYQVTESHVNALYAYAKMSFDCGRYRDTGDFLYYFRLLSNDEEKKTAALWGKLAAEILMVNVEVARDDLLTLRDTLFAEKQLTRGPPNEVLSLQQRTWMLHWSLFIFFNLDQGKHELLDFFFQDKFLNTVQVNSPHLLRYITAAAIMSRRKKNVLKDVVRVLVQEKHAYSDPISEFLTALYVDFDFESARDKLRECKKLVSSDFFLSQNKLDEEFMDSARALVFETYCRIHKTIQIKTLASALDANEADAEKLILQLIKSVRVDARIDSEKGHLIVEKTTPTAYQQVIDKTKALSYKSQQILALIDKKMLAKHEAS